MPFTIVIIMAFEGICLENSSFLAICIWKKESLRKNCREPQYSHGR